MNKGKILVVESGTIKEEQTKNIKYSQKKKLKE